MKQSKETKNKADVKSSSTNLDGSFRVTKEWFNSNRDHVSGLNRAQAEAVGESYPLRTGWKTRIVGKEITLLQKQNFESSKGLVSKVRKELTKNNRSIKIFSSDKEILNLEIEVAKLRLELIQLKDLIKNQ